jgi:signal transduction histidine kinase
VEVSSIRSLDQDNARQLGKMPVDRLRDAAGIASKSLEKLAVHCWNAFLSPLSDAIARRSKLEIVIGCLLLSIVIAYCEYLDRLRLSMVLLYIIPISISAWFSGARSALALTVLSMPIWFTAIVMKGDHDHLSAFSLNRFVLFSLLALVVARLKVLNESLEHLADKRAQALLSEVAKRERLEREMLDISEREQRRIGQELHDGLCQQLTGTAMLSHAHARKLTQDSEKESARKIVDLIEQSIWLARGVAKGLYPVETRSEGLMQAFEEFTSTTSDLFAVRCRFECHMPVLVDDPATAGHLFRIAQEAVCNAIKHGRATEIQISLAHTDLGLQLSVLDNGRGFSDPFTAQHGGMGLRTMAVRAKLIGGRFALNPGSFGGVEVNCLVPERVDA